jgi:hypothetical protein
VSTDHTSEPDCFIWVVCPNPASRMHPSMPFQIACVEIGCSPLDSADGISHAVINQSICNAKHTPQIMDAFEILAAHTSTSDFFGAEEAEKLQSACVTLKSSGFPNSGRHWHNSGP